MFDRLKMFIQNQITLLYTILVDLNIFFARDFGNNTDRNKVKRLGRWATRLYMSLFAVGLAVLVLYTIIRPQTLTKSFDEPSFDLYNQLFQRHGDKLICSCSSIASTYDRFVDIEARFHNVCSSPFVSEEGRLNLTADLVADLSDYVHGDYRRFLSAHLQFLEGLCQLSIQTVNILIQQFLSSLFAASELLSEMNFRTRLNLTIERNKLNASTTLTRLLFLIRSVNHGNAFISTYGTNFEYIVPWKQLRDIYIPSQAMTYDDDQCSCGLNSNCTTQAVFITKDPEEIIPIKGLKTGCTPSESFRASTLECFYDQSCIDLIKQYTSNRSNINFTNSLTSLPTINSRFPINMTIAKLIDDLFIEEWKTTINYPSYFEQCSPLLCSYTYIQQFNVFHTITILLGLQGGLTIVLEWICPKIIQIIDKIYQYRKKRTNIIQPVSSIETISSENMNRNIDNSLSDFKPIPSDVTLQIHSFSTVRCAFKHVLICVLLLFIITALVIFSLNIARQEKNQVPSITSSTTSTTMESTANILTNIITDSTAGMVTTTTSAHSESACSLNSQPISSAIGAFKFRLNAPVIADFNGDNRLDMAFASYNEFGMSVLLGYGNGSFKAEVISVRYYGRNWNKMSVGDLNKDNLPDFAITGKEYGIITILLGNGDGTFRRRVGISVCSATDVILTHVDGDGLLDMIVACPDEDIIYVYLGNDGGNFSPAPRVHTESGSFPIRIAVADFNHDSYQDIAVVNHLHQNIGIFLGYGNGFFQAPKTSFTHKRKFPSHFAIGDFNNDTLSDVAVAYMGGNTIDIMFGYGNGTLGDNASFKTGDGPVDEPLIVADFNGDRYLDIGFGKVDQTRNFLIGDGNGNFVVQTAFTVRLNDLTVWTGVGDFNGDSFVDVINVDLNSTSQDVFLNRCK